MKEGITPAKHQCTRIVFYIRSTKLICADAKNAKSKENSVVILKFASHAAGDKEEHRCHVLV